MNGQQAIASNAPVHIRKLFPVLLHQRYKVCMSAHGVAGKLPSESKVKHSPVEGGLVNQ
ncbi:TPA: hypothetical protein ACWW8I_004852 [Escherichia coli]